MARVSTSKYDILTLLITIGCGFWASFWVWSSQQEAPKNDLQKSIERFASGLPMPKLDIGTGIITGHVYTDSGEPLQGVKVCAEALEKWRFCEPEKIGAPPEKLSIWNHVVQLIRREHERKAKQRTALTGPDGSFRMAHLPEAAYRVTACLSGYKIDTIDGRGRYTVRPGGYFAFMAGKVRSMPVAIKFPDGTQPESAIIHIDSSWKYRWLQAQPAIPLEPGTYRLQALVEGEEAFQSEAEQVLVSSDGPLPAVSLLLKKRLGIRGHVIFPEKDQSMSCCLSWLRVIAEEKISNAYLLDRGADLYLARPGDRFEIRNIVPGTYLLGAGRNAYKIEVTERVTVTDAMVTQDLVLPPLENKPVAREQVGFSSDIDIPQTVEILLLSPGVAANTSVTFREVGEKAARERKERFFEKGKASLMVLAGRRYAVTLWDPAGPRQMEALVTENSEVPFNGKPINALLVQAGKLSGCPAMTDLELGDVIVGLDGKKFQEYDDLVALSRIDLKRDKMDLMVMRNGKPLSIVVSARPFFEVLNRRESSVPTVNEDLNRHGPFFVPIHH